MKSKVTFDLGDFNKGVIRVHTQHTEDVRDRIAREFTGGFGYNSNLAYCRFLPAESGECRMEIYPFTGSKEDSEKIVKNLPTEQLESLQTAIANENIARKKMELRKKSGKNYSI